MTRYVRTATPDTSYLNSFDLVILGGSAPSAHYFVTGDGGVQAGLWNGLTAPLINMNSSAVQGNRMGWFTGTSGAGRVSIGTVDMTVLSTSHPIFSGSTENSRQTSDQAGLYDLSADGGRMFLNAVAYMIPEPSALALFDIGTLALLLRRRSV